LGEIPAGTLVVVTRWKRQEQLAVTETPCYGPGRWPFVRRWMGDRWTKRPDKAQVVRVATEEDVRALAQGGGEGEIPEPLRALLDAARG
jgi:hypothetical protein